MRAVLGVALAALLIPLPADAQPATVTGCILYQHRDYGGAQWAMDRGSFMQMSSGEPIGGTGIISYYRPDWNDHVSSFRVVGPGCILTLYEHGDRWGFGATFRSWISYKYVGSGWNDKASWATCYCNPP